MSQATRSDRGVVVTFDSDRGFGFIRSGAYDEDVFVHATVIRGSARPLKPGQKVRFVAEPAERGPRAVWVDLVPPGRFAVVLPSLAPGLSAALGLVLIVATTAGLGRLAGLPWLGAYLAAVNGATVFVYALDKHRAARQRRRVPEWSLLALAAAGGSPGAALAMSWLRHKTRKIAFRVAFAVIVVVQVVVLAAWIVRGGA